MLLGLRDGEPSKLDQEISGFLLMAPKPDSTAVANFLRLYSTGGDRNTAAQGLIARGISADTIASALNFLATPASSWNIKAIKAVAVLASAALSGFHGYRRNQSVPWGLAWFVAGGIFPIVTPVIAVAQGYGKRKS